MWRYRLLLLLLFLPLLCYTAWQALRHKDLRYLVQRMGLAFLPSQHNGCLWFHAASVGEVNAIIPLILQLQQQSPKQQIVISSNTPSSAAIVQQRLPGIPHYYFPLDYRYAVKRLIHTLHAEVLFVVETEFWPNLYTLAAKNKLPLYILNGRISEKTLHARNWLKKLYRDILPLVQHVYARSDTDMQRFVELGLPENKVEVTGNIKFASSSREMVAPIQLSRPYILAASTREDEEAIIVKSWLASHQHNTLLVIAPRHPQRLQAILEQLKPFQLNIAIRSKQQAVTETTQVYIADTLGELKPFIAGAEFVIMGGSFVPKGGHNIIEVAQQGKAVIFGPDMRSFAAEADYFLTQGAGLQCSHTELAQQLDFLAQHKSVFEQQAQKLIEKNRGILDTYLQLISHIIGTHYP